MKTQAWVFRVISLIHLQWSSAHQLHSSATSLLVWRLLAAPISQVPVSKAFWRQNSGWEIMLVGSKKYLLGIE